MLVSLSCVLNLKYYAGRPVIERIERVHRRPDFAYSRGKGDIPTVMNGLGAHDRFYASGRDDLIAKRALPVPAARFFATWLKGRTHMSRVGKMPIPVPAGVEVTIAAEKLASKVHKELCHCL